MNLSLYLFKSSHYDVVLIGVYSIRVISNGNPLNLQKPPCLEVCLALSWCDDKFLRSCVYSFQFNIHITWLLLYVYCTLEIVCNNRDLALDYTITQEIYETKLGLKKPCECSFGSDRIGLLWFGLIWFWLVYNSYELFLWKQT